MSQTTQVDRPRGRVYLLLFILIAAVAIFWLLVVSFRLFSLVFLGVFLASLFVLNTRTRLTLAAGMAFLASTVFPIDIQLTRNGGPVRFVPVHAGKPSEATIERAREGEVVLESCVLFPIPPFYLIIIPCPTAQHPRPGPCAY